jgi:hypothetical protein
MFQILSFFYKQNLYLISVFGKSTFLLENKLRLSFAVDLEMPNVCFDKKRRGLITSSKVLISSSTTLGEITYGVLKDDFIAS